MRIYAQICTFLCAYAWDFLKFKFRQMIDIRILKLKFKQMIDDGYPDTESQIA